MVKIVREELNRTTSDAAAAVAVYCCAVFRNISTNASTNAHLCASLCAALCLAETTVQ